MACSVPFSPWSTRYRCCGPKANTEEGQVSLDENQRRNAVIITLVVSLPTCTATKASLQTIVGIHGRRQDASMPQGDIKSMPPTYLPKHQYFTVAGNRWLNSAPSRTLKEHAGTPLRQHRWVHQRRERSTNWLNHTDVHHAATCSTRPFWPPGPRSYGRLPRCWAVTSRKARVEIHWSMREWPTLWLLIGDNDNGPSTVWVLAHHSFYLSHDSIIVCISSVFFFKFMFLILLVNVLQWVTSLDRLTSL